jgi:muramoyltetrapeptide carboxypeptidase LdcA involved in peptidoglycan recycling
MDAATCHRRAILVGRTSAPDNRSLSQHETVLDALGSLNVPIIADIECGHVPPYMPIVNGGYGRIVHTPSRSELTQTLD